MKDFILRAFRNGNAEITKRVLVFVILVALCFWLMRGFLKFMGLPALGDLVLRFRSLELWVQLGFYLACFALLLLPGVGTLAAVL
jgi:hypothetical protein